MVVIRLRAHGSICGVCRVIVLPEDVHEAETGSSLGCLTDDDRKTDLVVSGGFPMHVPKSRNLSSTSSLTNMGMASIRASTTADPVTKILE